jgi:hypothetical protein
VALKGLASSSPVVDAGVGQVKDLIATSRMEVRQATETITAMRLPRSRVP